MGNIFSILDNLNFYNMGDIIFILNPGQIKKGQKTVQLEHFWPFLFCDGFEGQTIL